MHNAVIISPDGRDADDIVHESILINTLRGAFYDVGSHSCEFLMMLFFASPMFLFYLLLKVKDNLH